jgi:serine/threonine-protein kinase
VGSAVALCAAQWLLLQQALHAVSLVSAAAVVVFGQLLWSLWSLVPRRGPLPALQEPAEAERMMGLALHGRGDLLQAFARFRPLPTTEALKDNLYHLGKDLERKNDYAHAKKVFKHLLRRDMEYKDARARYRRAKAHLLAQAGLAADSIASSLSTADASSLPASVQDVLPRHKVSGPLGHYQLKHELGKGAMGVVYQGRDLRSGHAVAIKTLALQQEFDGASLLDARERFFKEAEAAGRLQHPHIVTIYASGEEQGLAYIAMELVAGTDLTAFTSSPHLLPVAQVLSIACRVAEALDYAHAHRVVHRDVKPANIMWNAATDVVKVMDFGVARITDASKTRTGIVLGTPSFMSPEQLSGAKVDGRADLYALGVTLFQLLAGSLPLRAESMPELMRKIVHVDAPDIRTLRPDLPEPVARLVAKALRKQPAERHQTGKQMAQDLAYAMGVVAQQVPGPQAAAVVYDPGRTPTGQNMVDLEKTVLEYPQERTPAQRSVVAPVG